MTRLADFAAHVVRWAFHLSAAIALTGCFASNTPTISRSEAEDVGRTLQYWMWNDEESRSDLLQFVRQDGKEYQLQLGGIDQAPLDPFANGIYIRRFGTRNAGPIYLVQFDLEHFDLDPDIKPEYYGFRYFSYLVAIDAGGIGTVGKFSCDERAVIERAAAAGIDIKCRDVDVTIPDLGRIRFGSSAARFLADLLGAGLIDWEDETGVGVLEWLE